MEDLAHASGWYFIEISTKKSHLTRSVSEVPTTRWAKSLLGRGGDRCNGVDREAERLNIIHINYFIYFIVDTHLCEQHNRTDLFFLNLLF
jgi:hypothetical protein